MAAKACLLLITVLLSCSYSLAVFHGRHPQVAHRPLPHPQIAHRAARPHGSLGHPRSLLRAPAAAFATPAVSGNLAVFDVRDFGAKADGRYDNAIVSSKLAHLILR